MKPPILLSLLIFLFLSLLLPSNSNTTSQGVWTTSPAVLSITSPLEGSTLTTQSTGVPLSAPLSVIVSIPPADYESFLSSHSTPPTSLSLVLSLSSMTTKEITYEVVSTVPLENLSMTLEGDLERLIPGRRSVRAQIVSSSGQVYGSASSSFLVVDAGAPGLERGAEVDVSAHTSAGHVEAPVDYASYFSQVYRYEVWSAHGSLGASSGPGSNLPSTSGARSLLTSLVMAGGVKRIIDVPCGDLTWMSTLLPLLASHNVTYLGLDVVPSLISSNTASYASPTVSFAAHDITSQPLPPTQTGDLVLCRHLMFHLPPASNRAVLNALGAADADGVLMTTYLRSDENEKDYVLAMGHKVNLFREPYCLQGPKVMVKDGDDGDMYLAYWQGGFGRDDEGCM